MSKRQMLEDLGEQIPRLPKKGGCTSVRSSKNCGRCVEKSWVSRLLMGGYHIGGGPDRNAKN